jgi:hypothetical protein
MLGSHELLPGLGTFPATSSRTDDGTAALKKFILDVVDQFINRAAQQERLSYHTYDILKGGSSTAMKEKMPEKYRMERSLPPDEVSVLVAFCRSDEHYEWIKKNNLYNARI